MNPTSTTGSKPAPLVRDAMTITELQEFINSQQAWVPVAVSTNIFQPNLGQSFEDQLRDLNTIAHRATYNQNHQFAFQLKVLARTNGLAQESPWLRPTEVYGWIGSLPNVTNV